MGAVELNRVEQTVRASLTFNSQRTVLIFAYECAPYNHSAATIGAQRPASFAKHLSAFGWRAIVLCRDASRAEPATVASVRRATDDALLRVDGLNPVIIPLPAFRYDGLRDRAWRRVQSGGNASSHWRVLARKALTVAKLGKGDHSQAWQPAAKIAAEHIFRRLGPVDACIGEHSPDAGVHVARWLSDRFRVPWVADFRDPILQPYSALSRLLYRPIAKRLLSTAAAVVNVTPYWTELDSREFRRPSVCIPNGFDEDEFPRRSPNRAPFFSVAYLGNINLGTQLEMFLNGLRLFRDAVGTTVADTFRFIYRGQAATYMRERARAARVSELLDAQGYIERRDALRLMVDADMLLLLSVTGTRPDDVFWSKGVYPGKTFEYFGARRPILCVAGDNGQLDELLTRTRTGIVLRSPEAIADRLRTAWSLWQSGADVPFEADDQQMAGYTRRNLTARLADVLNSIAPATAQS